LNELSTTPGNPNGEPSFTITHPFHPLYGHTFPLLSQRFAWSEERVFFPDQQTHEVRSLLCWLLDTSVLKTSSERSFGPMLFAGEKWHR
jgi:hypothetical protein